MIIKIIISKSNSITEYIVSREASEYLYKIINPNPNIIIYRNR